MRYRAWHAFAAGFAQRISGGFFCALLAVGAAGCERDRTPDWDTPGTAPAKSQTISAPAAPAIPAEKSKPAKAKSGDSGLRFVTYNVENWLTMDRYVNRKALKGAGKPDSEKQAVIAMLADQAPDVVGICEIGTAADLAEIQEKLKAAGVDLPNSRYTGGSDEVRHLGLLSRFPIVATAEPAETTYRLNGKMFAINRGILDATVEGRGQTYRFLGVHLKSKRESELGDQEAMRVNEARLLRRHVDGIFKKDPAARLIVYGDFNDTRATPAIKQVTGRYNDPTYLTAIPAKDGAGTAWTHYWALHDIYSRFDFVMVSRALRKEVDFSASHILDTSGWNDASDHRPVLAIFK